MAEINSASEPKLNLQESCLLIFKGEGVPTSVISTPKSLSFLFIRVDSMRRSVPSSASLGRLEISIV